MNVYETVIITRPNATSTELESLKEYLESKVGKIAKHELWGSKTLAYPIQKELKGTYSYYEYEADSQKVQPFEKWLNIQPQVLRFLTIKKPGRNI